VGLYRKLVFTLPDRALICQAKLACIGFHQHNRLGSEIAGHLSDLEEKLPKRVWFDFGLRKLLVMLRLAQTYLKSGESEQDAVV